MNNNLINKKTGGLVIIILILIVFLWLVFFVFSPIKVQVVSPYPGETTQTIYPTISVYFSRGLSKNEQQKVTLITSPESKGIVSWSTDGKIYYDAIADGLLTSKKYTVVVNFPGGSKTWSFNSVSSENVSQEDELKTVGTTDYLSGQAAAQFYKEHPWYDKTPLITPDYFVGFDSQNNVFFAYLYPNKTSSLDAQVANLKNSVSSALNAIGVNIAPDKIQWTISPK